MSRERPSVGDSGPSVIAPGHAAADGPMGGRSTPPRRREVTRELVLDAARDVFAERGVYGATVEDICARAGFTRGAFYSSFADKDDVLRALIAREHERLLAYIGAHFDLVDSSVAGVDSDPRQTMTLIADRLLHSVPADRMFSLIQAELEIHAVRDPEVARTFLQADESFRARIAEFLERGLARLGRELIVPVDDATDAIIAIVERGIRRTLVAGDGADPYGLAMTMLPLLIVALSRPVA